MIIFILRRLLLSLITLFILSIVGFSLLYYTPYSQLSGNHPVFSYINYITQLLQSDLGVSRITGQPIFEQLLAVFPATLELCLIAFTLALLLGLPIGILAGVLRGKWQDLVISSIALCGASLPVFWFGLLLMLFFSLYLGWFPVSGRLDLLYPLNNVTGMIFIDAWLSDSPYRSEIIYSALRHMVLPIAALTLAPATEVIRLMRISTSEVYQQNYIKVAAIRGLSRFTVIRRHVLHNALPPILAKLGLQFSSMLTLTMIIEVVFNWPGIGHWMIIAVQQQDYAAISAGTLTVGILVIVVSALADILGTISNPLKNKEWYAFR